VTASHSTTRGEPVLVDLGALSANDHRVLADAVIAASHDPAITPRGGDALADLADQLITRARHGRSAP
jgi:hypothetical protein